MDLSESGLSDKIIEALTEAGFHTAGKLVLASKTNPEKILEVSGVGPKTLEKIENFGSKLPGIVPEEEIIESEEVEEELKSEQDSEAAAVETPTDGETTTEETTEVSAEKQVDAILEEGQSVPEESASESTMEINEPEIDEKIEKPKKIEKIKSFEELFKLELEDIKPGEHDPDDKSAQKKKKSRQIEYDPDLDVTISKKKRKRTESDWSNWEED